MRAILISRFLDQFHGLEVSDIPDQKPSENDLLIKVIGAGVNYVDALYVSNLLQLRLQGHQTKASLR